MVIHLGEGLTCRHQVALQVLATMTGNGRPTLTKTGIDSDDASEKAREAKRFVWKEEFPFDSNAKRMSVIYIDQQASETDRVVVFLKGSVRPLFDVRWPDFSRDPRLNAFLLQAPMFSPAQSPYPSLKPCVRTFSPRWRASPPKACAYSHLLRVVRVPPLTCRPRPSSPVTT